MYGVGIPELVIVLVLALVVFGGSKLPEIGRGLGRAIKEFKAASKELTGESATAIEEKSEAQAADIGKKS